MRKFLSGLILIPLGVILVVFAVANRHSVTVSFDPFNASDPALGVTLPLFLVIIVVAALGVIAGGAATWLRQSHWRRAARRHETEARVAQAQLTELRDATRPTSLQSLAGLPRPASSPMQDKQRATL